MSAQQKISISEQGRELGWMADRDLLESLSEDGWDTTSFHFDVSGLVIGLEREATGVASKWVYDVNQEGGSSEATIGSLKMYAESTQAEVIFACRVGTSGAEREGFYVRFYCRKPRNSDTQWEFPFEYCGVIETTVITGFQQVHITHPPTTHPKEWELIGIVKTWNEQQSRLNGRRMKIYKRPTQG